MRWTFELCCPACGSRSCEQLTPSPEPANRLALVVVCVECRREFVLAVALEQVSPGARHHRRHRAPGSSVCGSESGYHAHRARGETPVRCEHCVAAHRDHNRESAHGARPDPGLVRYGLADQQQTLGLEVAR